MSRVCPLHDNNIFLLSVFSMNVFVSVGKRVEVVKFLLNPQKKTQI